MLHRGLDFQHADQVFAGFCLDHVDTRKDYDEPRYQTMGVLNGTVVMVVWTPRDGGRRIISMRKCNDEERERYHAELDRSG
ncbi:BrnT family toxin [Brevundimonas sp.]|uniref:BrnT family toxin n=1 Tax=Brevundimonas sp. TaxID=1871086 RepID=UPI0039190BBF